MSWRAPESPRAGTLLHLDPGGAERGDTGIEVRLARGEEGDVAELAALAWLLVIKMRMGFGQPVHSVEVGGRGADDVQHCDITSRGRVAQGEAEAGAQVVLELAGRGALDAPVAGVVHARRHLVGQHGVAAEEELDGEHADVLERLEGASDGALRLGGTRGADVRGR